MGQVCVRGLITKELVVLNFNDIHILVCVGVNVHSLQNPEACIV